MAERNLNTTLKQRLINNEPFAYAHLIKYERPYATLVSGKHSTDAKRYAYLTDATVNIIFNDGTSQEEYTIEIKYNESIQRNRSGFNNAV